MNKSSVWDSGPVASPVSLNVPYGGSALVSGAAYDWQVTVWDTSGAVSATATATFAMGLLNDSDWHGAAFIDGGANDTNHAFSNTLTLPAPVPSTLQAAAAIVHGTAYVLGLGYHRLWVNGAMADPDRRLGAYTQGNQRVLYDVYNVTTLLEPGCNAIGVLLGRGWYAKSADDSGDWTFGRRQLRVLVEVQLADGSTHRVSACLYRGKARGRWRGRKVEQGRGSRCASGKCPK